MANILSISNLLDVMVPITRFNKGEANRIFDEVKHDGVKIVVKNNSPECVLISPTDYQNIIEKLKDYSLFVDAQNRVKDITNEKSISHEDIMQKYGISDNDLNDIEVEFEK